MAEKILIVEDESIEAMDIKRSLESFGYEVPCITPNGDEAVKIALATKPDLILIDIILNGKTNGIDVASRIKDEDIPFIYLTAHSEESTVRSALNTEPYGYLIKPFDRTELKYAIELTLYKNKMSRQIKASEEKYRRLAENSKDMIYRMTIPDGVYQYVNPAAETITEFTSEQFYNSTRLLNEFIHPDYKDYYKKTWEKLLKGEMPMSYEYKIITKSGKEKWLNQRNTLINDKEGHPIAIEGTVTDITKRKQAEEALIQSEIRFHNKNQKLLRAQRVAKIGIWENHLETNDLRWSEEMYKILGVPINTPVNLEDVVSIFPPEELKRFQNAVDAAINENAPYSIDYKIIRKDGKIRYIHDEGQIIHDNDGNAISMFGTTQDITKRKLVEESLKESEAKFRYFVETSPDMIWEIDTKGNFTYISPQSSVVLGYKPEEIIGNNIVSLISPGSIEHGRKSLFAHINGPNKFNTIEVSAKHRNGNELIIEIRSVRINDKNGQVKGFQGIARDITDKTISTNQLKTSIKEKDVLLQEIHHRVKNNMQIISSLLNLQIRHVEDNNAIDLLKESQNRVRSMAMIHEKLYQSNDFTHINITEYIESLVSGLFYSYSISKEQIIPIINVDDVQLNIETAVPCGLIINELVSNSLKHGFPKEKLGEVYISLKIIDDNYELVVGDNGIKFPKDINFRSTDSLGLQLVNNLVNQIDGRISLDTTHGTEFKIIFKELKYKNRI